MSPSPAADRAHAVAAAAAHDINNELTMALWSLTEMQTAPDVTGAMLAEMGRALRRCVGITAGLLAYSHRHGAKTSAAPMRHLVDEVEKNDATS